MGDEYRDVVDVLGPPTVGLVPCLRQVLDGDLVDLLTAWVVGRDDIAAPCRDRDVPRHSTSPQDRNADRWRLGGRAGARLVLDLCVLPRLCGERGAVVRGEKLSASTRSTPSCPYSSRTKRRQMPSSTTSASFALASATTGGAGAISPHRRRPAGPGRPGHPVGTGPCRPRDSPALRRSPRLDRRRERSSAVGVAAPLSNTPSTAIVQGPVRPRAARSLLRTRLPV